MIVVVSTVRRCARALPAVVVPLSSPVALLVRLLGRIGFASVLVVGSALVWLLTASPSDQPTVATASIDLVADVAGAGPDAGGGGADAVAGAPAGAKKAEPAPAGGDAAKPAPAAAPKDKPATAPDNPGAAAPKEPEKPGATGDPNAGKSAPAAPPQQPQAAPANAGTTPPADKPKPADGGTTPAAPTGAPKNDKPGTPAAQDGPPAQPAAAGPENDKPGAPVTPVGAKNPNPAPGEVQPAAARAPEPAAPPADGAAAPAVGNGPKPEDAPGVVQPAVAKVPEPGEVVPARAVTPPDGTPVDQQQAVAPVPAGATRPVTNAVTSDVAGGPVTPGITSSDTTSTAGLILPLDTASSGGGGNGSAPTVPGQMPGTVPVPAGGTPTGPTSASGGGTTGAAGAGGDSGVMDTLAPLLFDRPQPRPVGDPASILLDPSSSAAAPRGPPTAGDPAPLPQTGPKRNTPAPGEAEPDPRLVQEPTEPDVNAAPDTTAGKIMAGAQLPGVTGTSKIDPVDTTVVTPLPVTKDPKDPTHRGGSTTTHTTGSLTTITYPDGSVLTAQDTTEQQTTTDGAGVVTTGTNRVRRNAALPWAPTPPAPGNRTPGGPVFASNGGLRGSNFGGTVPDAPVGANGLPDQNALSPDGFGTGNRGGDAPDYADALVTVRQTAVQAKNAKDKADADAAAAQRPGEKAPAGTAGRQPDLPAQMDLSDPTIKYWDAGGTDGNAAADNLNSAQTMQGDAADYQEALNDAVDAYNKPTETAANKAITGGTGLTSRAQVDTTNAIGDRTHESYLGAKKALVGGDQTTVHAAHAWNTPEVDAAVEAFNSDPDNPDVQKRMNTAFAVVGAEPGALNDWQPSYQDGPDTAVAMRAKTNLPGYLATPGEHGTWFNDLAKGSPGDRARLVGMAGGADAAAYLRKGGEFEKAESFYRGLATKKGPVAGMLADAKPNELFDLASQGMPKTARQVVDLVAGQDASGFERKQALEQWFGDTNSWSGERPEDFAAVRDALPTDQQGELDTLFADNQPSWMMKRAQDAGGALRVAEDWMENNLPQLPSPLSPSSEAKAHKEGMDVLASLPELGVKLGTDLLSDDTYDEMASGNFGDPKPRADETPQQARDRVMPLGKDIQQLVVDPVVHTYQRYGAPLVDYVGARLKGDPNATPDFSKAGNDYAEHPVITAMEDLTTLIPFAKAGSLLRGGAAEGSMAARAAALARRDAGALRAGEGGALGESGHVPATPSQLKKAAELDAKATTSAKQAGRLDGKAAVNRDRAAALRASSAPGPGAAMAATADGGRAAASFRVAQPADAASQARSLERKAALQEGAAKLGRAARTTAGHALELPAHAVSAPFKVWGIPARAVAGGATSLLAKTAGAVAERGARLAPEGSALARGGSSLAATLNSAARKAWVYSGGAGLAAQVKGELPGGGPARFSDQLQAGFPGGLGDVARDTVARAHTDLGIRRGASQREIDAAHAEARTRVEASASKNTRGTELRSLDRARKVVTAERRSAQGLFRRGEKSTVNVARERETVADRAAHDDAVGREQAPARSDAAVDVAERPARENDAIESSPRTETVEPAAVRDGADAGVATGDANAPRVREQAVESSSRPEPAPVRGEQDGAGADAPVARVQTAGPSSRTETVEPDAAAQRAAAQDTNAPAAGGQKPGAAAAGARNGHTPDGQPDGSNTGPAGRGESGERGTVASVQRTDAGHRAGGASVTVEVTAPDSGTVVATVSVDPARPADPAVSIDPARPADPGQAQQGTVVQVSVTSSDGSSPAAARRGSGHGPDRRDGDQPATPAPSSTHGGPGPDGPAGPSATAERSGNAQPGLDAARPDRNDPSAAYNAGHDPDTAGPAPPAPTRTTPQHPADTTTGGAEPTESFRDGLGPEDNCVACTRARLNGTPVEKVGPATPRSQDAAEMREQLEHDYTGRFEATDRAGLEQRMDDAPEGTQAVVWTWEPGSSRSHWFTGTKTAHGTVFDEPLTNVRSAMVLEPGRSREQGPRPELDHPPLVGTKRKVETETRSDIPPVVHAEEPSALGQEAPGRLAEQRDRLRRYSDDGLVAGYRRVKELVRLGAPREQIIDEVHALVAEAFYRVKGYELWDHQAVAAYELGTRDGTAVNVRGGGGKSIVLMMGAAVDALYGRVDIVTTTAMHDKDIELAREVLGRLKIKVGLRERGEISPDAGREVYEGHHVVYGAQTDVMVDVLHDELASPGQRMRVQGPRSLIKDEIDYLGSEEARSPVVLADRADGVSGSDQRIQAAREAVRDVDLSKDVAEQLDALSSEHRIEDLVEALRAERMQRDVDYMTVDAEVQTYSEESGTRGPGQRYNGDLHSFLEAKEGTSIRGPLEHGSALSVAQFDRTYQRVTGASATAAEAAGLLKRVYGMRVVDVPSTVKGKLTDKGEHTWVDIPAKLEAATADAAAANETGRPFLVVSEPLPEADLTRAGLKDKGIDTTELNDRPDNAHDADTTIQGAGQVGAGTVASNFAGRGTDIVLSKAAEALGGLHVVITDFAGRAGVHLQKVYRAARGKDKGSVVAHRSLRDKLLYRFADPVKHQALLDKYADHPRNVEIKDKAVDELFREARENATAWTERQVAEIAEHPERATTFTYRSQPRTKAPVATTAKAAASVTRRGREVAETRTQLAETKRLAFAAPGAVLAADDQRRVERAAAELAAAQQRLGEALGHYRSAMAEAIGRTSLNLESSAASVPADSLGIDADAVGRVERFLRDGDLVSARALLGRLAWRAGQLADSGGNRWGAGPSVAAAAARALAASTPSGPVQRVRLAISLSELRGLLSELPVDARLWQQTIRDRARVMRAHADDLDRAAARVARDNAGTLRRAELPGRRGDRISSRDEAAQVRVQIGALRSAAAEAREHSERLLARADRLVGWPAGSAPEHHHPAGVVAEHAPDGFPMSPGIGVVDDAHAPRGRDVQLEGEHVVVPGRQQGGVQGAVGGLLTGSSARLDGGEQRGGDREGKTADGAVIVEQDVVGGVARVGEAPLAEHRPDVQGIDDVPAAQTLDQAQAGAGVGRRPERVAALGAEQQPLGGDVDVQGVGPGDHRPVPPGVGGAGPRQQRVVEQRSPRQPPSRLRLPGVELGVEPGFGSGSGVDGFAAETHVGPGGTNDHPVTDPPGLADRTPQTHDDHGNHSGGRLPPATEAGEGTGTSGSGGAAAVGGASHEAQNAFRQVLTSLYGRGWRPDQHRLPFARGPPVVLIDRALAVSLLGEPWRDLPSRLIAFGWQHPEYAPNGVIVLVTETWRELTRPGAVPAQWWRRLVEHETGFHLGRPELVEGRTHEADERWLVEALPATARASMGAEGKAYGTAGDERGGHDDPSHPTAAEGAQQAIGTRTWSRLPRGPPAWLARAGLLLGGATFTVGAVLGIGPTITAPVVLTATSVAAPAQQVVPSSGQITVRAGDTLSSLAAHLGVPLADLIAANPQVAGNPNRIAIGQRLTIPPSWDGTWTVRRGDILSGIALSTGRSVPELLAANPWLSGNPNLIRPGQRITVVAPTVAAPPIKDAPPAEPTPAAPPVEQSPRGGWDPSGPIATLILAGAVLGGWALRSGLLGRALGGARDRLSALSQAMARWYAGATGAMWTAATATVRGLGVAASAVGTKARRVVPRVRALWAGARSVAVGARGVALARRLAERGAEDGADPHAAADDLGASMRQLARSRIAARTSAVASGASPSLARRVMAAASGDRTGAVAVAAAALARSTAAWVGRLAQVRRLTGAVASAGLAGAAWGWMWTTPGVGVALAGASASGLAAWLGWNAVRARGSTARGWSANLVRAARVAGRLLPAFAGAAVLVGNLAALTDFVDATVSASLDTDVTRAESVVKTVASLFAALIVGVNTGRSVYYRALRRAQTKDVHVRQLRDAVRSGIGSFGVNTMNYLLRLSVVVIPSGAVVAGAAQLLAPGSISASALVFLFAAASTAAQLKWVGYTRLVKGLTSGAVALTVLPLVTGLNISAIAADWPAWFAPLGLYLVYSSVSSVTGDVVVDLLGRFGQRWSAVRTRADLAITYYRGTSTTLKGWRRPLGVVLRAGHFFIGKGITLGWPMRWKDLPRGQKAYRMLLDWRAFSRADWRSMAAGVFDTMVGSVFGYIVSRPLPEPVLRWLAGPPPPTDPTAPPVPVAPLLDSLGYVGLRLAVAGAVMLAIWPLRNRVDKWFAKVSRLWRVPSRAFPFGVVLTRGPPWLRLRIGGLGARTASLRDVLAELTLGHRGGAPTPVATRPDRAGADSVARRLGAAIRLRTPLPPPLRAEAGDSAETRAFKRAAAQGWRELDRNRRAVLKQAVGVLAAELDGARGALAWRAGRLRAAGRWDDVDTVEFLDELLNRLATSPDRSRGELEAGLNSEVKAFQAARIDFLKGPLRELALHQSREAADDHVDLTNRRDDDQPGDFGERIRDAEQRRIRAEKLRSRVEFELAWERGRSYSTEGLVAVRELFEVLTDEAGTSARLEQTMRDRRGRTGTPKASELARYRDLEALYTVLLHAAQLRDEVELIYSQRRWTRQRWQARITSAIASAPSGTRTRSLLDVALLLAGRDRSLSAADLADVYGSTPEFWTDQLTALTGIGAAKAVGDDTYRAADELRAAWRGADPRLRGALLRNPAGLGYQRLAALTKAAKSQIGPRTRTRQQDGYRALIAVLNAVDRAAPYYKQGLIDWLFGRARAVLWSYQQLRDPSVDPTRVPDGGGSARALRKADRAGLPALLTELDADTRLAHAARRHLRLAQNTPGLDEELLAWAHAVRGRTRTALEERIELVEHAAKAAGVPSSQLAEWTHRARQVAADPVPDPREELQLAVDAMWVAERALRDAGRRSQRAAVRYGQAGELLDQDRSAPVRLAYASARADYEAARDAYDTALGHAAATIVRWHHADRSAHKLDVVREFGVAGVELRGDYRERALRKRYPALGGLTKSSALESRRHPAVPSLPEPMSLVGANRTLDTWRLITGAYRARHPEMFAGDTFAESARPPLGFTKDQLAAGLGIDDPSWLAELDTRLALTRPELDTVLDALIRSGLLTADWRGGPTYYRPSDRVGGLLAAAPVEFGDALLVNPLVTTLDLGAFGLQHARPGDRLTNQASTLAAALVAAAEIATLTQPSGSGPIAFGGLSDAEQAMLLGRLPVWAAAGLLTPLSGPLAGMPRGPPVLVLVLDSRSLTREQRSVLRRVVAFAWNGAVVLTGEMAAEIAGHLGAGRLSPDWWRDVLAHEVGFHLHATHDPATHDADAQALTEALRSARVLATRGPSGARTTRGPPSGLPLVALDGATYQGTLLPEKTTGSGTPRIVTLRTADGRTVVAKQHDPTVLISSVTAAAIYRLAGVLVPDTALAVATTAVVDDTGRTVINAGDLIEVGDFVTGSAVRLSTAPAEIRDQLARQYAVTALLGDWDGTMSVNLVLAGGVVHRIDFDQALRNHRTHPLFWRPTHRPMIFGQLTEADVLAQFADLHSARDQLLAVVPNAELRRVVAGRLARMGRMASAGHLGQGLGRQLADDQRAHARRFPHDRRPSDGYPSPSVGTAPHGFAAAGTTRVVTGAQLRRLVARGSPVWVHSAKAGGRWQVTTTVERPRRLRAAWRLIVSATPRILVAAALTAGLGGMFSPVGVDRPTPVQTVSVTAAPVERPQPALRVVEAATAGGRVFTAAGTDTAGGVAAGLGVSFADLDAANGGRFTGPGQRIGGQPVTAPSAWDGRWRIQPGDSLWRIFRVRFADPARYDAAVAAAGNRADLLYTADAPLTAQPPPPQATPTAPAMPTAPITPAPVPGTPSPLPPVQPPNAGPTSNGGGWVLVLAGAGAALAAAMFGAATWARRAHPRGGPVQPRGRSPPAGSAPQPAAHAVRAVRAVRAEAIGFVTDVRAGLETAFGVDGTSLTHSLAWWQAGIANTVAALAAAPGRLVAEVRAQVADLREQWRIGTTFADLPAWAREPGTMPRRYGLRVGFELRVYFPGTNLAISEVFGSAFSSLVQHFTHLKVATTDEVDSYRARRAEAKATPATTRTSDGTRSRWAAAKSWMRTRIWERAGQLAVSMPLDTLATTGPIRLLSWLSTEFKAALTLQAGPLDDSLVQAKQPGDTAPGRFTVTRSSWLYGVLVIVRATMSTRLFDALRLDLFVQPYTENGYQFLPKAPRAHLAGLHPLRWLRQWGMAHDLVLWTQKGLRFVVITQIGVGIGPAGVGTNIVELRASMTGLQLLWRGRTYQLDPISGPSRALGSLLRRAAPTPLRRAATWVDERAQLRRETHRWHALRRIEAELHRQHVERPRVARRIVWLRGPRWARDPMQRPLLRSALAHQRRLDAAIAANERVVAELRAEPRSRLIGATRARLLVERDTAATERELARLLLVRAETLQHTPGDDIGVGARLVVGGGRAPGQLPVGAHDVALNIEPAARPDVTADIAAVELPVEHYLEVFFQAVPRAAITGPRIGALAEAMSALRVGGSLIIITGSKIVPHLPEIESTLRALGADVVLVDQEPTRIVAVKTRRTPSAAARSVYELAIDRAAVDPDGLVAVLSHARARAVTDEPGEVAQPRGPPRWKRVVRGLFYGSAFLGGLAVLTLATHDPTVAMAAGLPWWLRPVEYLSDRAARREFRHQQDGPGPAAKNDDPADALSPIVLLDHARQVLHDAAVRVMELQEGSTHTDLEIAAGLLRFSADVVSAITGSYNRFALHSTDVLGPAVDTGPDPRWPVHLRAPREDLEPTLFDGRLLVLSPGDGLDTPRPGLNTEDDPRSVLHAVQRDLDAVADFLPTIAGWLHHAADEAERAAAHVTSPAVADSIAEDAGNARAVADEELPNARILIVNYLNQQIHQAWLDRDTTAWRETEPAPPQTQQPAADPLLGQIGRAIQHDQFHLAWQRLLEAEDAPPGSPQRRRALDLRIDLQNQLLNGFYAVPDDEFWGSVWRVLPSLDPRPADGDPLPALLLHWLTDALDEPQITGTYDFLDGSTPLAGLRGGTGVRDQLTLGVLNIATRRAGWVADLPRRRRAAHHLMPMLRVWTHPELVRLRGPLGALLDHTPDPASREDNRQFMGAWAGLVEFLGDTREATTTLGITGATATRLAELADRLAAAKPADRAPLLTATADELARAIARKAGTLLDADIHPGNEPDMPRGSPLWNATVEYYGVSNGVFRSVLGPYLTELSRTGDTARAGRAADRAWKQQLPTGTRVARDHTPADLPVTLDGEDLLIGTARDQVEILHLGDRLDGSCLDCVHGSIRDVAQSFVLHPALVTINAYRANPDGTRGQRIARVTAAETDAGIVILNSPRGTTRRPTGPAFRDYLERWATDTGQPLVTITEHDSDRLAPDYDPEATAIPEHDGTRTDLTFTIPEAPGADRIWTDAISQPGDLPLTTTRPVHRWTPGTTRE